jgi:L-2-hydroxyglutarate oxidase LhgO
LTIALTLRSRHPDRSVLLLEKEDDVGEHASGRNSGVLHSGFYYSADSMKARFCLAGNRAWKKWCLKYGVPLLRCGKLVVARSETEHAGLDKLLARATRNGVDLIDISEAECRKIEPRARTAGRALFSPRTASINPKEVVDSVRRVAVQRGVDIRTGVTWLGPGRTSAGPVDAGFVINAAGLQADRVARHYGFSEHYRILPFKGLYLHGSEAAGALRCHIYPVPDMAFPFLGVHFTVTVDGHLKIGPTALPALWRENYGGLSRFSGRELVEVLSCEARMFVRDPGFRRLAAREVGKSFRRRLVARASGLLEGVDAAHYRTWGRPGIRAQLVDRRTNALVTDFVVQGDARSLHVLNAVSPAFTCALPFAKHVVKTFVPS